MRGSIQSTIWGSAQENVESPCFATAIFGFLHYQSAKSWCKPRWSADGQSNIAKAIKCNLGRKQKKKNTYGRELWASFQLITSRKGEELLWRVSALARWPQKLLSLTLLWNQSNQKWRESSSAMATTGCCRRGGRRATQGGLIVDGESPFWWRRPSGPISGTSP